MARIVISKRHIVAVSSAALMAVGAAALAACSGEDPPASEPPATAEPTVSSTADAPARFATIHSGRGEACADILRVNSTPVSEETADADNRYFGEQLIGNGASGNVRSVGRSSCGNLLVVVVGMKISTARLPAYGPGGTPVLAYKQRPVSAF